MTTGLFTYSKINIGIILPVYIVCCAVLIIFYRKEEKNAVNGFVIPSVIIFALLTIPFVRKSIESQGIRGFRFYWIIFAEFVIAFCIAMFLGKIKSNRAKCGLAAIICAVLLCTSNVYTQDYYSRADNSQKVTAETREICDIIKSYDDGEPRVVMTEAISEWARQYDASIRTPYTWFHGSDMTFGYSTEEEHKLAKIAKKDNATAKEIARAADAWDADYIVTELGVWPAKGELGKYGYTELEHVYSYSGEYVIYGKTP